jgi:hypothetical protein
VSLATSRRRQLDLLLRACARAERVRLAVVPADDPADSATTRLLALDDSALLLYWPGTRRISARLTRGAMVEVQFSHDEGRYSFKAQVRGRAARRLPGRGLVSALVLSLPLRVERKQQRAGFRTCLAALDPPLHARCTSMVGRDIGFALHITNVSPGGLGGTTTDPAAGRVNVGDLFWAEFDLPGDERKTELVIRLADYHTTQRSEGQNTQLGCAFCPSDDPLTHQDSLRRLERFIREQQQTTPERAVATPVWRR